MGKKNMFDCEDIIPKRIDRLPASMTQCFDTRTQVVPCVGVRVPPVPKNSIESICSHS
jgi:hypothetical protein